jgi:peroxiredoxin/predicted 2-oxoglutarate/Fe(II)-dependent dioxygenase YbiX
MGEPAPWFEARASNSPRFHFHTVAGRYIVLCFFRSAVDSESRHVLEAVLRHRDVFDDDTASFFGVSVDPDDERMGRVKQHIPGFRLFWDFDRAISRLYGACAGDATGDRRADEYRRFSLVLDERLRVVRALAFAGPIDQHVPGVLEVLRSLPGREPPAVAGIPAPVLVVPRVFEPDLCRALIRYYERHGGNESGFMVDAGGKTVAVHDYGHKRRRDCVIADASLRTACHARIARRLAPQVHAAFQFRATRIERYLVSCYESRDGGHFRAHRDNTTKGTAHRRFAVSLNLNTGEYDGGLLTFPEFGRQRYAPPLGGAVVFSCSLLHEATPVTRGRRFAFLPFLYDDAGARIREENRRFLAADQAPPPARDQA